TRPTPPSPPPFPYTTLFRSDVHEQPQPKREVRSEGHHQNETGEHCPDDAPRGVDAVGAAHLAPARRRAGRDEIGEQREGHAHPRSEEHTSELQSRVDLVCRL